jgi:hypothetical protein
LNRLSKFFLRAESSQVFAVVFGTYALGLMAFGGSLRPVYPEGSRASILLPRIFATLCDSVLFLWLGLLGLELDNLTRQNRAWSVNLFVVALAVSETYLIVFYLYALNPGVMNSIGPLAVLATFCVFYVVRFVAKTLVLAETGKVPTFRDYLATLLLVWFFPVGIWSLQPRINQLFAARSED